MTAATSPAPSKTLAVEPIFVFGATIGGEHIDGSAAVAARFHGAEAGKWNGLTGNSYAVPYRGSDLTLLALPVIQNYVTTLFDYAAANPDTLFHIARFGCEKAAYRDADMAPLFKAAPRNCVLSAMWQRVLEAHRPVRLLIFDPAARLESEPWQDLLARYLALNRPLWGTAQVEIVSIGAARNLVANDAAARKLGLKHRIVTANAAYYREQAHVACEMKAMWYSTHLLTISDPDQTSQPGHVRILSFATRDGLHVEELYPDMFD